MDSEPVAQHLAVPALRPPSQEQGLLQTLMDSIPDGIYFKDTAGRFIKINRGQARNLGIAYEADALGRTDFDFFTHAHAMASQEDEQQIMATRTPLLDRLEHYTGINGRRLWISTTKVPTLDAEGRVTGIVGISRDITERMAAEGQIKRQDEFIKTILANLSDGIVACNNEGIITLFNDAARLFHNLPAEPIAADRWAGYYSLYQADGQALLPQSEIPLFRALQGETVRNAEAMIMPAGGGPPRTIVASGNALFDAQGHKLGAVVAMRDVTEQKRAEAALREAHEELEMRVMAATAELRNTNRRLEQELADRRQVEAALRASEERLRFQTTLLEAQNQASLDGILVVASDGTILSSNRRFLELWGFPADAVAGANTGELQQRVAQLIADMPGHRARVAYLNDHPDAESDDEIAFVDGRIIARHSKPLRSSESVSYGRIWFFRDITERRRAEEERARLLRSEQASRAEAEAAIVLRDEFLSVAAHELKTPVTALLGYTELLVSRRARGEVNAERTDRALEVMAEQGRRLARLIGSLLDISRLRLGHFTIEPRPIDISALARRVVDEMQPLLQEHTLTAHLPAATLVVAGDDLRLEQVLQNLLQNAVKYSPHGGEIRLDLHRLGPDVVIAVTDHGMGIPEASSTQLFQRFYRASNIESTRISGMGLGLYIVKEIVDRHGGSVAVQSAEGHGSTFTIRLPLMTMPVRRS